MFFNQAKQRENIQFIVWAMLLHVTVALRIFPYKKRADAEKKWKGYKGLRERDVCISTYVNWVEATKSASKHKDKHIVLTDGKIILMSHEIILCAQCQSFAYEMTEIECRKYEWKNGVHARADEMKWNKTRTDPLAIVQAQISMWK